MAGVQPDRIKFVRDPLSCIDDLKFAKGETIYLLYGTDPLSPARKVREKLEKYLKDMERLTK